jgi:hypothetical protein
METLVVVWSASLAAFAKVGLWLAVFVLTLGLCPEAFAVALEPPLLKCFPPRQQAVILAHLGAIAMASIMLLS